MEISKTSREEARVFATKHGLSLNAQQELAELLERTWQDGMQCEQTTQFLESLPLDNVGQ